MKSAVLYARVSSKDQEREGFSIPAQKKLLHEYASKHDLLVAKEFVEAETAKKVGRKQFHELLKFLKTHPDCKEVLVEKTDRLYRNFTDYVQLDPDALDIRIHFVKENTVLSSESRSHEKLMHGIKVVMARAYIDNLSEEVKKGQTEKALQGIWPSCAPLGFVNKLDDHTIVPHPDVAPLIVKAFELASTGQYSLNRLRQELYKHGLRSKRSRKMLGKNAISRVLQNSIYYGPFDWGGTRYEGRHQPLISKALFDAVQEKLGLVQKPRMTKHSFTYAGLLTCGHCGCAITAEKKRKKSGRIYVYYRCTNGKGICENVTYLREEAVETAVTGALRKTQIAPEIVEFTRQALLESFKDEQVFHETAIKNLNARYQKLQSYIDQCYMDKLDGRIEPELWERKTAEWRSEQIEIRSQLQAHEAANTRYLFEGVRLMELAAKAADLYPAMTVEEKRQTVGLVLSNPKVTNGSIEYSYKMPFAMMTGITDLEKWRE